MEDQPEGGIREHRQVAHIPLDCRDPQSVAISDLAIASQLFWGVIEHRDVGTGSGQKRPLLPAARSQAENIQIGECREPVARGRFARSEENRPLSAPGSVCHFWPNRHGPTVPLFDLSVPSSAVVLADVHDTLLVATILKYR